VCQDLGTGVAATAAPPPQHPLAPPSHLECASLAATMLVRLQICPPPVSSVREDSIYAVFSMPRMHAGAQAHIHTHMYGVADKC
jgi:hypothetical protein